VPVAPVAAPIAAPAARAPSSPAAKLCYEQLSQGTFYFAGFRRDDADDAAALRALQRLVLLHGGLIADDVADVDAADGGAVVVPRRDWVAAVPDAEAQRAIVALHEAGAPVVDPSWLHRLAAGP
jgi:hypothetical protein